MYGKLHQRFYMTTVWRKEWIERKGLKVAEAGSPSSEGLLTPFVHCTQGSVAFQSLFKPITITGAALSHSVKHRIFYFDITPFLTTERQREKVPARIQQRKARTAPGNDESTWITLGKKHLIEDFNYQPCSPDFQV